MASNRLMADGTHDAPTAGEKRFKKARDRERAEAWHRGDRSRPLNSAARNHLWLTWPDQYPELATSMYLLLLMISISD